jgi:hypothetical protein
MGKIERALRGPGKRIAEGKLKDRFKMERKLGRIQACHPPGGGSLWDEIEESKQGTRLVWRQKPEQQQWVEAREGAYLLRANLTAGSPAELWKQYIQLTEVEAVFRTLKSELAIRPLFHQLEKRVKVHYWLPSSAMSLLVTPKHLLKRSAAE